MPRFILPLLMVATAWGADAQAVVGEAAPAFTTVDHTGASRSLSDHRGSWVVLEWINFDCPFVQKHYEAGNIPALQQRYTGEGAAWLTICSSAPGAQGHFAGAELERRLEAAGWQGTAYLVDESGEVGRLYGARTTPHIFIIDPEGRLVYDGAIDSIRSVKQEDIERATNYVDEVFAAAKAGEPVPNPKTKPYGCSVKYR